MKTQVTFEYQLPGTIPEVSRYFSDFMLFGKHHPYMFEVIETGTNRYCVKESLMLWGCMPMNPCYEVDVQIIEPAKHIYYQSEVKKGLFLYIDYTFIEDVKTGNVKIIEAMILKGYPIINPIFIGILKKSRVLLIESIRKELLKNSDKF